MNEALRDHVTRIGFNLTLGTTHIAAMVLLDVMLRSEDDERKRYTMADQWNRRSFFVPAIDGVIRRGLAWHQQPDKIDIRANFFRNYGFTKAGIAALELLRESGIYEEYERALPVIRLREVG